MLTKVIIADDHQLIRIALKSLVDLQLDMRCIASCSDLNELAVALECEVPQVVICDLHFGSHNALEFIRNATGKLNTHFIVSSAYPSEIYAALCWAVGAVAYVHKASDSQALLNCVRHVAAGKVDHLIIDPTDQRSDSLASWARHAGERLTDREWEVFVEIGNGSSTEEMASKFFLSAKTIETHRVNIKRKLDIQSKDKLVSVASKIFSTQIDPVGSTGSESRKAS